MTTIFQHKNTFLKYIDNWATCDQLSPKVFKKNTVIHQYRPYFLRSKKGQMSYDVFVCGKNIAFEYQGKQHFEPVDFFGGEKHFQEQVARDRLKKKLSEENGVTLIYVNYNEDVSVELIKEKVAQALDSK